MLTFVHRQPVYQMRCFELQVIEALSKSGLNGKTSVMKPNQIPGVPIFVTGSDI